MPQKEDLKQYGTLQSRSEQQRVFFMFAPNWCIREWYRERTRPTPIDNPYRRYDSHQITEENETILVARNDPLIDATLALWAENDPTVQVIYRRWFPDECEWPPKKNSVEYSILHSLLSNPLCPFSMQFDERKGSQDALDDYQPVLTDERLGALLSDHAGGFITSLCLNPGCLERELSRMAAENPPYDSLPEASQVRCLEYFVRNERFHRTYEDGYDGPDYDHWKVHESILSVIAKLPKTLAVAQSVALILSTISQRTTASYFARREAIAAASAWDCDLPDLSDPEKENLNYLFGNTLSPAERVRFQILRLYRPELGYSADSSDRVMRMMAYVDFRLRKKRFYENDFCRLDRHQIKKFATRDGSNFKYAIAFNKNIYADSSDESFGAKLEIQALEVRSPNDVVIFEIQAETRNDELLRKREDRARRAARSASTDLEDTEEEKDVKHLLAQIDRKVSRLSDKAAGWVYFTFMFLFAFWLSQAWKEWFAP
jgi:hypothetical protein